MKHFLMTILATLLSVNAVAQSLSRIYIEDFEIFPDSSVTVPVMLANVERTRGLQFYLTLPEGLQLGQSELTQYSIDSKMILTCRYSEKNACYMIFIYPSVSNMYPPDTLAVMNMEFQASSDFKGGDMLVWKCRGSTANNRAIVYQDDTTTVTVPTASLIGIPMDKQQLREQYFNLQGQPIDSPLVTTVAIQVTTLPNGQRYSRKVAVAH